MRRVEIVAVGDELLRGIVAESNSHWIALRLAARGASLDRVTILPDVPELVGAEIRLALDRGPRLLVTHGGLGPTDDDRTREAIALGLGIPQVRSAEAEAIVRRRYAELVAAGSIADPELGPARLRMADLPEGATPLDNHAGTAPGFLLEFADTTIVALPGVPVELVWIWEHTLAPALDELLGPGGYADVTLETDLLDESKIASSLRQLQLRHSGVYVKSRAAGFEPGAEVRVTLHATGRSDAEARAAVDAALADLRAALHADGVTVRDA